ncbi:MAG: acetate--CoA ligase family protein [Pseudomonadota bacterium]
MADTIQLAGTWQAIEGMRFGLQQASVMGTVKLGSAATRGLALLEGALQAFVAEPLPPRRPDERDDIRLLSLFAFVYAAVQREARIAVGSGGRVQAVRAATGHAVAYSVCLPIASADAGRVAVEWACRLCNALLVAPVNQQAAELAKRRDEVLHLLQPFSSARVNTYNITLAAFRLGIPVMLFDPPVLLLGTGRYSRWMESSLTDATPAIGARMARHKNETSRVLRAAGLPGGVHQMVTSADHAVQAAAQLGYPVVVKPSDQERGAGVSADLMTEQSVRSAWELARQASPNVLVEKFAPGATHRLTVFQGQVIRVSRRIAGGVTGDGVRTIAALVVEAQQTESQRRAQRRQGVPRLALDDEALGVLAQDGRAASDIPAAGMFVRLRRRHNINAGGSNESVKLDGVHPDNLQLARDAARLLRLDFAGIDLIMGDISRSWLETEALICEVNAQPQMAASSEPEVWDRVLRELVGPCARIPARLLIVRDDRVHSHALAELIAREEPDVSVSCGAGLWVAKRRASMPFESGFKAAQALLRRTDVNSAVCLMTLDELEREGLPMDRWDRIESDEKPAPGSKEGSRLQAVMATLRAHIGSARYESGS